ncbi:MAG: type II toxin-antitoxin system VapC family toxin [Terracidiphilus sp.]
MPDLAVIDSSAILAVFFNEPGAEIVLPILHGALLSTINLAEVHTRMLESGARAQQAWSWITSLQCEACFFSDTQARLAAELRSITRPFGLSLGDRACLALALERKATVYTTDRVWKQLDLGIEIEVIR